MKIIRRVLKWLGILLGLWIMLAVVQLGWGMYREPIAKAQATEFCSKVKEGQPVEGIEEQALASGAEARLIKWIPDPDGSRVLNVIYIGMPPFSRHMCAIKANTLVISAEYVYLD